MTQISPCNFDLPPKLHDAEAALALVAELKKLPPAEEIQLNAAAVRSISPVYLQILISTFKTFPRLSVSEASAAFSDAFAAYGLAYPQALPQLKDEAPMVPADSPLPADDAAPVQSVEAPAAAAAEAVPALAADAPPPAPAPVEQVQAAAPSAVSPPSEPAGSSLSDAAPQTEEADVTNAAAAKTILTIDDSRTMRDMLKMALGSAGFTVLQAVDGQDGLNVLARQPVDVIITDINMPKLDGYGVIRAVRSDPAYNATPILVLSTEAEQESKDIAKDAGATGWIVKPFDPEGLVNLVNAVCA